MFESHLTHHFFRLWGIEEGRTGIQTDTVLLGNSQNEFDHKLGDVAGKAGCRFFLIEFKRKRNGIAAEVSLSEKPHRHYLYWHLREDQTCRQLAFAAHFAAYPDAGKQLAFEPYAHAVAPLGGTRRKGFRQYLTKGYWHELDYPRIPSSFKEFYAKLTDPNSEMSAQNPGFFLSGLGLPQDRFEEYIDCMYEHLQRGTDSKGNAVLGIFDPTKNEFIAFGGSVEDLVKKMHAAFKWLAANMPPSSPSRSPSPSPWPSPYTSPKPFKP
jgi:hypothetical protein